MSIVTIGVVSTEDARARLAAAFRGETHGTRTPSRRSNGCGKCSLPNAGHCSRRCAGTGAMTIREIARRVGRDVKAVHGDVHALLDAGVLNRTRMAGVVFPYDAVHVDFMLQAA